MTHNETIIKEFEEKFDKRIEEFCIWERNYTIKTIIDDINKFWIEKLKQKDKEWKEKNNYKEIPIFKGTLEKLNNLTNPLKEEKE